MLATVATKLRGLLQAHGLVVLGIFSPEPDEELQPGRSAEPVGQLVLTGNAGSAMWKEFNNSPEQLDGRPDALDRWSRRIGLAVAAEMGGRAIFPFDGPPYPPFLQWASRTGRVFTSPISLSIHHQYGLWHAYRFALALPGQTLEEKAGDEIVSPCVSCEGQPCLNSCPVEAFSPGIYRVDECADYLRGDAASSCRVLGCKARHACPEAAAFRYQPDHAQFHMTAFVKSRSLSFRR